MQIIVLAQDIITRKLCGISVCQVMSSHPTTVHLDHGHRHGTDTQHGQAKETHRLVGLKQNMELYGTIGRGPLLITSSASTSFFPSAWLSRSTLPPTRTQGHQVRGVVHVKPTSHSSQPGNRCCPIPNQTGLQGPSQGRACGQEHSFT